MASREGAAITTQPRLKRKKVEKFVNDLDPTQVVEWSNEDVVEKYLKPINMEHMAKAFLENNINGAVLLALEESHLKELGCANVGNRILFLEFLKLLKKHKRDADRSRTLWSGTTPVCNPAYHPSCASFCRQALCPSCVDRKEWRITGQGIHQRDIPSTSHCCSNTETQFVDYRFLKELELHREPKCCCCCVGTELLIISAKQDSVRSTRPDTSTVGEHTQYSIMHPEAAKAESIIRNAWAEVRLVEK